jgi:putative transposase
MSARPVYELAGKAPGLYDQIGELPALKLAHPLLNNVHSQVLKNVAVRLDLAMQAFFRRAKSGEKEVGYPRFKGFGRLASSTLQAV